MLKKTGVFIIILIVVLLVVVPINASPSDVVLDRQVELDLPGVFKLIDDDRNQKAEAIQFSIGLQAYRDCDFLVIGNLEGEADGGWVAVATTVIPFKYANGHDQVILLFYPDDINKLRINGPYRVTVSLQQDSWSLPEQVAGFSPGYSWDDFEVKGDLKTGGAIASSSAAKRAAEAWAGFNKVKLGKFLEINFNYDSWRVDYQGGGRSRILRLLVSPAGKIKLLRINKEMD